jgi:hypothetical protein
VARTRLRRKQLELRLRTAETLYAQDEAFLHALNSNKDLEGVDLKARAQYEL